MTEEDAINAVKWLYGGFGAMANINAIPSADVVEGIDDANTSNALNALDCVGESEDE